MLTGLEVASVEPYADGNHELVSAIARFAVDPDHPANARIVDLGAARRGDDGLVHFDADLRLIRPVDVSTAHRLLFVVANRGMHGGLPFSTGVGGWGPMDEIPHGDAFVLRRGWSVLWCGWQWDVPRPAMIGLGAPEAEVEPGWVRVEFRTDAAIAEHALSDVLPFGAFTAYAAADLDQPDAQLTVRDFADDERRPVDRSRWRFAHEVDGAPVADDEHVWLDGGFEANRFYEVVYRTRRAPVVGAGLLAIRDAVSHVRNELLPVEHTIGYGASQSCRVLRQLVHEGLNVDEQDRTVFDGVLGHIGGGRLGEFNHRYGQPSVTSTAGFGYLPPWDTQSLYARQAALGGMPKTIFTNSAWEYWRGDGALTHVAPDGSRDLPEPPYVRSYLLAGIDHIGELSELKDFMPLANRANPLGGGLLLRAAFANLEAWVCDGEEPPPSQVPRLADGTAVGRDEILDAMAEVAPGLAQPDRHAIQSVHELDLGPDAERGVGRWPVVQWRAHAALVSAVDDDGNEVAGLRVPELAAPLGTYTAWNPRAAADDRPAILYEFAGSWLPFDRAELVRRYPDREAYVERARQAAEALVAGRYLLAGDVDAAVASAVHRYDALTRPN